MYRIIFRISYYVSYRSRIAFAPQIASRVCRAAAPRRVARELQGHALTSIQYRSRLAPAHLCGRAAASLEQPAAPQHRRLVPRRMPHKIQHQLCVSLKIFRRAFLTSSVLTLMADGSDLMYSYFIHTHRSTSHTFYIHMYEPHDM